MTDNNAQYAIIAGTGFTALGEDAVPEAVETRFGAPSSPLRRLEIGGREICLLARHGDRLSIPPHAINYRANLAALAAVGTQRIIAMNTVGVITADRHPGQLAVPDQVIDYTFGRGHSIYDGDTDNLEHIEFTEPFAGRIRASLLAAAKAAGVPVHDGGVYAVMQGPRLETAAEVDRLERDGADYVGMTAMPEASLARELEMDYACLSLIVNYAAGRGEKAIHADIEASTAAARMQAMKVLQEYFRDHA